ncbi:MAG: imelysin family protein [Myxococcota bacterium]|nr:imelysin family protein [Myxococcota bacterium]
MLKKSPILLAAAGTAAMMLACSACSDSTNKADAVKGYAEIVEASYADSVSTAETLNAALKALVATPSEANLQAAKDAWLASREPYLQTEVYRFYEGPIDNETDGPEGLLNAWPMDENYVDYTSDDPTAGLINDTAFEITEANLEGANEVGGEKNIATGFHTIEFLLWGQDMSETTAGTRPYTDYVTDGTGTAANQDRRGLFLTTCGDLLVKHLQGLHTQWAADGTYRGSFEAAADDESIEKILTGMIILAGFETGGERLQAALDSGDREDEHSCFSDNTHRDMIQDIQGIHNVYVGSYTRVDGSLVSGASVQDVVADTDSALADRLGTEIMAALDLANALQIPFESEIAPGNTEGNGRVQSLITALRTVEGTLEDVFTAMGFSVPVAE